jgi:hypothetical protein
MDKSKFDDKKEWRNFGLGLAGIVLLILIIQFFLKHQIFWNLPIIALLLLMVSLFIPILLKPLYILFSYISLVLGWMMTRFIITLLFYLVLTPIGLIAKIVGKKFLETGFKKEKDSYWKEIPTTRIDKSNYEKQF